MIFNRKNVDKRIEKIRKKLEEMEKNNEFLINENSTLKQINHKRYVQQEDKMDYLIKRDDRLQTIEQMVANKTDFRKIRKFIEGGNNENN